MRKERRQERERKDQDISETKKLTQRMIHGWVRLPALTGPTSTVMGNRPH